MKIDRVVTLSLPVLLPLSALSATPEGDNRPNILVIMVDDMGFSDAGYMGSEISTPNIDYLASEGLKFSNFYNCGRSCPTRASMLTGLYPHKAGVGRMAKNGNAPGYEGSIKQEAATIAEVLSEAGYNTGMVGKWHVSATAEIENHNEWLANRLYNENYVERHTHPLARGFNDFYGVLWGVVNFFNPFSLCDGYTPVTEFDDDYYITYDLTRKAVEYIDSYSQEDKPFFLYLAHTAPHWPLHAPEDAIAKYKGVYDGGWEEIRNARYKRMEQMGLFEEYGNVLSARQFSAAWEKSATREWDARAMEVHAAMIDCLDAGIGEVLETLKRNGELDNTLILLLSDNGCSPEEPQKYSPGLDDRPDMLADGTPIIYPKDKSVMPGAANTMTGVGAVWANVCNTPYRYWKAKMYEGGIKTSMVAMWGDGIEVERGSVIKSSGHVTDIMATCLDVAGVTYPQTNKGLETPQIDGESLVSIFKSGKRENRNLYFEHFNERAIHSADGWKAVCGAKAEAWELYNLNIDPTEMHNVADENPELTAALVADYQSWANRSLVYPMPGAKK